MPEPINHPLPFGTKVRTHYGGNSQRLLTEWNGTILRHEPTSGMGFRYLVQIEPEELRTHNVHVYENQPETFHYYDDEVTPIE